MNLVELRERMYVENIGMFKEFFLEDDENIKYVITNEENEKFRIVDRVGLVNLIHNGNLKIEYVEHGEFSLGILNNESVKVEYV